MFEIFKLIWDAVVLRDQARKGQLKVRTFVIGFGFVVLLYAIALPAVVLYSNHPQYKLVFIAAVVLDGLLFVAFMVWAIRGWRRQVSASAAASSEPRS
jgi:heme/copper-type cytochrome/quinol oxidase subunit 4